jgi:hypothetical protein
LDEKSPPTIRLPAVPPDDDAPDDDAPDDDALDDDAPEDAPDDDAPDEDAPEDAPDAEPSGIGRWMIPDAEVPPPSGIGFVFTQTMERQVRLLSHVPFG